MPCRFSRSIFGAGILALAAVLWIARAGNLQKPQGKMKALDAIPAAWSQVLPADQRFELVMDGDAVLDKETGLVWERSPQYSARAVNYDARYCAELTLGGRKGWRLPSWVELQSLVDPSESNPALPAGHPFLNIVSGELYANDYNYTAYTPQAIFGVDFATGKPWYLAHSNTATSYRVWCVRGYVALP